jgi:hypothetical protein
MDLALEQISKGDVHNARFGLMLTDNAVELVLHRIAKDKASELKHLGFHNEKYEHQKSLEKALGRNFEDKVKFARIDGKLSEESAQTITILHTYRNEVYHIGLKHESILPALSAFYFDAACDFLSRYRSSGLSWGSNLKLPERAKKYFHGTGFTPGGFDDFRNGCMTLRAACKHDADHTITVLADELDQVIEQQNVCIDIIARGVYEGQQTTRDGAVRDTQVWKIAFTEEGRAFALSHGFKGSIRDLIEFLSANYSVQFRSDPIPSWNKQAATMRANRNPHAAMAKYHSFMISTANVREALEESAGAAEAEIEAAVDRMREERLL